MLVLISTLVFLFVILLISDIRIEISQKNKFYPFLYSLIFKVYLFLDTFKYNTVIHKHINKVYDYLGLIDTLGYSENLSKFTYGYSSELLDISQIKINKFVASLIDNCSEKTIVILF